MSLGFAAAITFALWNGPLAQQKVVLERTSFLGGSSFERAVGIASDGAGHSILLAWTGSTDIPFARRAPWDAPPHQASLNGPSDAFLTKTNAAGTDYLFSTYFGGSGSEEPYALFVDDAGNSYITGTTDSDDLVTRLPFQGRLAGGTDGFVAKFGPGGDLLFATYLGGAAYDLPRAITVDDDGLVYVTGRTASEDFPMARAAQGALAGSTDAFLSVMDPSTGSLVFSTYYGGSQPVQLRGEPNTSYDDAYGLGLMADGVVVIGGVTNSTDLPGIGPASARRAIAGETDAFVAFIDRANAVVASASYAGGSRGEIVTSLAVHPDGFVVLAGGTSSIDLQGVTARSAQPTMRGGEDAFVVRIDGMGSSFSFASYLGGARENVVGFDEYATAVKVDPDGHIYVGGLTDADDFPVDRAFQGVTRGGTEGWIASISPDGASVDFATYLGGRETDVIRALEVRAGDVVAFAGESNSTDIFLGNGPQKAIGSRDASDGIFGWIRSR